MCTVSVFRLPGDSLRLACNRDEQMTRAAAWPPVVRRLGQQRAAMPVDPVSNGTWVAANDAGVVMALLNHNPADAVPAPPGAVSRGTIIPSLLSGEAIESLVPESYGPFRLLVLDKWSLEELLSDGRELRFRACEIGEKPLLFTSSGLGDHVVERPRRELFERMLAERGIHARTQDAFHEHQWPKRPHLSVRMRRRGARTVSSTVVEVGSDEISMAYRAFEEGRCEPEHVAVLRRQVPACF